MVILANNLLNKAPCGNTLIASYSRMTVGLVLHLFKLSLSLLVF